MVISYRDTQPSLLQLETILREEEMNRGAIPFSGDEALYAHRPSNPTIWGHAHNNVPPSSSCNPENLGGGHDHEEAISPFRNRIQGRNSGHGRGFGQGGPQTLPPIPQH